MSLISCYFWKHGNKGGYVDTLILYAAAGVLLVLSLLRDGEKTKRAIKKGLKAFEGILPQFLVVLVLVAAALSLFDSETISALIGERSGILGVLAAALVGAITLIPGFVAFPAAAQLLKSGAGALQIAAFVSTLMMVGVVTLPLEIKYFGRRAAIARNSIAFGFSFLVAIFVAWVVSIWT
jgi:uncharacterized membrane protein YraQ (UPF0718 family)